MGERTSWYARIAVRAPFWAIPLMACTPGNAVHQSLKTVEHFLCRQFGCAGFGDDVDIPPSPHAVTVMSEAFSGQPLDPIASNRFSHTFGDSDAKTAAVAGGGCNKSREKRFVNPPSRAGKEKVLPPLSKPVRLGERLSAQSLSTLFATPESASQRGDVRC